MGFSDRKREEFTKTRLENEIATIHSEAQASLNRLNRRDKDCLILVDGKNKRARLKSNDLAPGISVAWTFRVHTFSPVRAAFSPSKFKLKE